MFEKELRGGYRGYILECIAALSGGFERLDMRIDETNRRVDLVCEELKQEDRLVVQAARWRAGRERGRWYWAGSP